MRSLLALIAAVAVAECLLVRDRVSKITNSLPDCSTRLIQKLSVSQNFIAILHFYSQLLFTYCSQLVDVRETATVVQASAVYPMIGSWSPVRETCHREDPGYSVRVYLQSTHVYHSSLTLSILHSYHCEWWSLPELREGGF